MAARLGADAGVLVDDSAGVRLITIHRPRAGNSISPQTIAALRESVDGVASTDVRAVVIRGSGSRIFVAGGDLKQLGRVRSVAGATKMASQMRRLLDDLAALPIPVVAALNGHAFGGGAEVAVAADIRIAAAHVRIAFNQVVLNIMPAWGGGERLTEVVGRGRALLLMTTGDSIDADEAAGIGLVDRVVPSESFEQELQKLIATLGKLPRRSAIAIKRLVLAAKPHDHTGNESTAVADFAELWTSHEHWAAAAEVMRRLRSASR